MAPNLFVNGFTPLKDTVLFKPLQLGALALEHRVIMAPLTRFRAIKESDGVWVPRDLIVEHYSQRATKGGFLISEASPISRLACGYPGAPGIFTASQVAGWKKVTDAVHAKGGFIFCQIWHVGRTTVPGLLGGHDCVSSSNVPLKGKALDGTQYEDTPPKALTIEEIQEIVQEYAAAAKRAVAAGFDGVEIHGANGYLVDQFLHDNINLRTDSYGGSIENRSRFALEVVKAVTSAIGSDRVGIRLSPWGYFQQTRSSNRLAQWSYLTEQLAALPEVHRLAYVHMMEPRYDEVLDESAKLNSLLESQSDTTGQPSLAPFRNILQKAGIKFLAAGNFGPENALPKIESGEADGVVFGRWFIANPDLPKRLAEGLPFNPYDRSTFYGSDPPSKGYVDYPFVKQVAVEA